MKKWLLLVVAMWLSFGLICPARATITSTITFDNVPTPKGTWGVVPDGYLGFDWTFIEVQKVADYQKTYKKTKKYFQFPGCF